MTDTPTTPALSLSPAAAAVLAAIDRHLNPPNTETTTMADTAGPPPFAAAIDLERTIGHLAAFAGAAIAAPLTGPATATIHRLALETKEAHYHRRRADHLGDLVSGVDAMLESARNVIVETAAVAAVVDAELIALHRRRIDVAATIDELDAIIDELEEVIRAEGRNSGRRLTSGMAAARIREARRRARAKVAAEEAPE